MRRLAGPDGPLALNLFAISLMAGVVAVVGAMLPIPAPIRVVLAGCLPVALILLWRLFRWGLFLDSDGMVVVTHVLRRPDRLSDVEGVNVLPAEVGIMSVLRLSLRVQGGSEIPVNAVTWYRTRNMFHYGTGTGDAGVLDDEHRALISRLEKSLLAGA